MNNSSNFQCSSNSIAGQTNEETKRNEARIRKAKSRERMSNERKNEESLLEKNRKIFKRSLMSEEEREMELKKLQHRYATMRKKEKEQKGFHLLASSKEAEPYRLGDFAIKCAYCPAIHFPEEENKTKNKNEFLSCCNYGKFSNLELLIQDYPADLKILFDPNDPFHNDFMKRIRTLNSNFSCASLACMKFNFGDRSIPIFKIQGAAYHSYNTFAFPNNVNDELPTNGQLYFVDTEEALNYRINALDSQIANAPNDMTNAIIAYIENFLRENYEFAKTFKMLKDVIDEEEAKAAASGTTIPNIAMLFGIKEGIDLRTYNIPKANEVCAIVFMNANDEIPSANFVMHYKGSKK